jgi:hypothetical protein
MKGNITRAQHQISELVEIRAAMLPMPGPPAAAATQPAFLATGIAVRLNSSAVWKEDNYNLTLDRHQKSNNGRDCIKSKQDDTTEC